MPEQLIATKKDISRLPLGIKGLDEQMEGGIPRGSIILLTGAAGTMKSSVSFNSLYWEAQSGSNVLYISLEQSYISLLNHMINMGYDFQKVDVTIIGSDPTIIKKKVKQVNASKKGHIILSDLGALRATLKSKDTNWWGVISKMIKVLQDETKISACVIDSLNSLTVLSSYKDPRSEIFYLYNFFKSLDLTTYLISEMPKDGHKYCEFEIEDFLADGVIAINLIERNRKVTREISVVKLRATNVNTDVFTLNYGKNGFEALYGGKMPLL